MCVLRIANGTPTIQLDPTWQSVYKWKKQQSPGEWYKNILVIKATTLPLPINVNCKRSGIVPLVLFDLLRHLKPRQTKRGLARMLGVGRATIDRAISRLKDYFTFEPIETDRGVIGYTISEKQG